MGFRCMACQATFSNDEAGTADLSITLDDISDRGTFTESCEEPFCIECGSTDLREVVLCDWCYIVPARPGSDFCASCTGAINALEREHDHRLCLRAAGVYQAETRTLAVMEPIL